jgi:hypothetical protein
VTPSSAGGTTLGSEEVTMQRIESPGSGGWTPERKAVVGISAIVFFEILERVVGLRTRGGRAVSGWWLQLDDSTRRDLRRAEADLLVAPVRP